MIKTIERPTLEKVSQAFTAWRAAKTYRREKTPQHLWDLVRTIIPSYPRREIEIALSITKEQLDREAPPSISGLCQRVEMTESPKFIELSVPELLGSQTALTPCSVLRITRSDGSSWSISEAPREVISESLGLFLQG